MPMLPLWDETKLEWVLLPKKLEWYDPFMTIKDYLVCKDTPCASANHSDRNVGVWGNFIIFFCFCFLLLFVCMGDYDDYKEKRSYLKVFFCIYTLLHINTKSYFTYLPKLSRTMTHYIHLQYACLHILRHVSVYDMHLSLHTSPHLLISHKYLYLFVHLWSWFLN